MLDWRAMVGEVRVSVRVNKNKNNVYDQNKTKRKRKTRLNSACWQMQNGGGGKLHVGQKHRRKTRSPALILADSGLSFTSLSPDPPEL